MLTARIGIVAETTFDLTFVTTMAVGFARVSLVTPRAGPQEREAQHLAVRLTTTLVKSFATIENDSLT